LSFFAFSLWHIDFYICFLLSFLGTMKKPVFVVCVFLLVVMLSGCTQQQQKPVERSYTNTRYGFSLNPPAGWEAFENETPYAAVRFSPVNVSNVSLVVAPPVTLDEGRALSTYADQFVETYSDPNITHYFTVESEGFFQIGNLNAYRLLCSFQQAGNFVMLEHVAIQKTRSVYIVLFTVPYYSYPSYSDAVNQSIASFLA
jgi:hypothetical protein